MGAGVEQIGRNPHTARWGGDDRNRGGGGRVRLGGRRWWGTHDTPRKPSDRASRRLVSMGRAAASGVQAADNGDSEHREKESAENQQAADGRYLHLNTSGAKPSPASRRERAEGARSAHAPPMATSPSWRRSSAGSTGSPPGASTAIMARRTATPASPSVPAVPDSSVRACSPCVPPPAAGPEQDDDEVPTVDPGAVAHLGRR